MKLGWMCWYMSGMFTLLCLTSLATTYAPGAETFAAIILGGTAGGALLAAGVAIWLERLPAEHWIHRSKPVWAVCIAATVAVTAMAMMIVG